MSLPTLRHDYLYSCADVTGGCFCKPSSVHSLASRTWSWGRIFCEPYVTSCSIFNDILPKPNLILLAKQTQRIYSAVRQPPYKPPPQVFGPAWTALYVLMGYAAHRAWATGTASLNPTIVQLTKVRNGCHYDSFRGSELMSPVDSKAQRCSLCSLV